MKLRLGPSHRVTSVRGAVKLNHSISQAAIGRAWAIAHRKYLPNLLWYTGYRFYSRSFIWSPATVPKVQKLFLEAGLKLGSWFDIGDCLFELSLDIPVKFGRKLNPHSGFWMGERVILCCKLLRRCITSCIFEINWICSHWLLFGLEELHQYGANNLGGATLVEIMSHHTISSFLPQIIWWSSSYIRRFLAMLAAGPTHPLMSKQAIQLTEWKHVECRAHPCQDLNWKAQITYTTPPPHTSLSDKAGYSIEWKLFEWLGMGRGRWEGAPLRLSEIYSSLFETQLFVLLKNKIV